MRHAVHEREHVHAPSPPEALRVFVELVEHHLGNGILLQLDDDVHRAVAVGAVMNVGNLGKLLSRMSSPSFVIRLVRLTW